MLGHGRRHVHGIWVLEQIPLRGYELLIGVQATGQVERLPADQRVVALGHQPPLPLAGRGDHVGKQQGAADCQLIE